MVSSAFRSTLKKLVQTRFRPVLDYFKHCEKHFSKKFRASKLFWAIKWFFWIWSLAFWIDKIDLNEKRRERHPFFCPALFSTSFVHRQTRGVDSDYFGEKYKKSPQSLIQVLISDTLNYQFTVKNRQYHFYHFQGLPSGWCFKNNCEKFFCKW